MGKAKKCSQRTSDGAKKTCHRSYGEAKAAGERLRLEGRDVEIYPHGGHFHLRAKRKGLYVVPSPARSPRKPQNVSTHRGGTKRGSSVSTGLSGGSTEVAHGEGRQGGADSLIPGRCQEVNSKREKFLRVLTGKKIMCYNSRFSRNGHMPYIRFMGIYHHITDKTDITDKTYKWDLVDKTDKPDMSDISDLIPPYTTNSPYTLTNPACRIPDLPYTPNR